MIYKYKVADKAPPKLRLEPSTKSSEKAKGKIGGAKNATLDI